MNKFLVVLVTQNAGIEMLIFDSFLHEKLIDYFKFHNQFRFFFVHFGELICELWICLQSRFDHLTLLDIIKCHFLRHWFTISFGNDLVFNCRDLLIPFLVLHVVLHGFIVDLLGKAMLTKDLVKSFLMIIRLHFL